MGGKGGGKIRNVACVWKMCVQNESKANALVFVCFGACSMIS